MQFKNCRGQCCDGAAAMSGHISGLQTRVRAIESRALFTHCRGHKKVIQDEVSQIAEISAVMDLVRSFIVLFVVHTSDYIFSVTCNKRSVKIPTHLKESQFVSFVQRDG